MRRNLPDTSSATSQSTSSVNRVLGDTSGPNDGNVRAIITVLLTLGFLAFCFLVTILFVQNPNNEALRSVMTAAAGALGLAFATATGMYFGVRSQQTAQGPANAVLESLYTHLDSIEARLPHA